MTDVEQMLAQVAESYNTMPYESHAFKWCSPAYIRAAAYLYGVDLPAVQYARVLEIGCAAGGNSLPFAFMYPDADIVAIDIAEAQIAEGQRIVKQAQLKNISLKNMSMTELPNDLEPFDYVIAHGVLSWIPKQTQTQIFRVVEQSLGSNGGAYISFNTYPGWRARESLRDLMLWHSRGIEDLQDKVDRAREVIPFLAEGVSPHNLLQAAKEYLAAQLPDCESQDYYLAHEYLELHNHPLYLVQMTALAEQANLRYVGDAQPKIECPESYQLTENKEFLTLQSSAKHAIAQQQYLDFAVGRSFRKSLLTSNRHSQEAFNKPDFSRLADLLFAGSFEAFATKKEGVKKYRVYDKNIKVKCAKIQAMLALLHQSWPRPVSGRDLLRVAEGAKQEHVRTEDALKQLFMLFPLEMSRSYEDLPACLQDLYSGLIPGAATIMAARYKDKSSIAEFNAWYSSSTAKVNKTDLFVVETLEATKSPLRAADTLEQAWRQNSYLPSSIKLRKKIAKNPEKYALRYVQRVIDRLHKYAMYI